MASFRFRELDLPGCVEIRGGVFADPRGLFVKTFVEAEFQAAGLPTRYAEEFHSVSRKDVVRGLHFQAPPAAQGKIFQCVSGEILDAFVDLRTGSPSFGRHGTAKLAGGDGVAIYLPEGIAHGFLALSREAVVMYKVTAPYSPSHDGGILWNSAGIDWPTGEPILSERDRSLPALGEFRSPFRFPAPGGKE